MTAVLWFVMRLTQRPASECCCCLQVVSFWVDPCKKIKELLNFLELLELTASLTCLQTNSQRNLCDLHRLR